MENLIWYAVIGFLAQLIDGSLGMAYGVSANTLLLAAGLPPAAASASVHTAKMITGALSGLSHLGFGNVDRALLVKLVTGGVVGAVLGSYFLTRVSGDAIRPFISFFLLLMGLFIIYRAFRSVEHSEVISHVRRLGFIGGFLDAIGGGGWGPVVVTALVARGSHPRMTIGTVNLAEFFVAVAASITFMATIGLGFWPAILGLGIGGAIAAPISAYLTRFIPPRPLMVAVGILISLVSAYTLLAGLR